MDTDLCWESNRLVVQQLYIESIASEKGMDTSGCTEKCTHQFTFTLTANWWEAL